MDAHKPIQQLKQMLYQKQGSKSVALAFLSNDVTIDLYLKRNVNDIICICNPDRCILIRKRHEAGFK